MSDYSGRELFAYSCAGVGATMIGLAFTPMLRQSPSALIVLGATVTVGSFLVLISDVIWMLLERFFLGGEDAC